MTVFELSIIKSRLLQRKRLLVRTVVKSDRLSRRVRVRATTAPEAKDHHRVRRQFEPPTTPPLSALCRESDQENAAKELIEAHEKEREDNDVGGNLVETTFSKKKTTPKKKTNENVMKTKLDDEEDDATLRSTSSTEQCFRKYRACIVISRNQYRFQSPTCS